MEAVAYATFESNPAAWERQKTFLASEAGVVYLWIVSVLKLKIRRGGALAAVQP
jgi:hypothetical protein